MMSTCKCKRSLSGLRQFLVSQPGKQTIAMYILANISRSQGNQTMTFGQIILSNMRNVLLEKFYTKCGEAIPRPFPKKSKFSVLLGQQSKVI